MLTTITTITAPIPLQIALLAVEIATGQIITRQATGTIHARVTGQDGEHLITTSTRDFDRQFHCSCGGKEDKPCNHIQAFKFYL